MLLLRHASAGERLSSPSIDRFRQLDAAGRSEARQLVWVLAEHDIERVVTSPLARCVETVAPIADVRRVVVERRNELLPEARIEDTRVLLEDLPDASLVCTHHEVILQLFGGEVSCEEAGTLVLQRDGALWTPVSYIAPPGTAAEPFARTLAAR